MLFLPIVGISDFIYLQKLFMNIGGKSSGRHGVPAYLYPIEIALLLIWLLLLLYFQRPYHTCVLRVHVYVHICFYIFMWSAKRYNREYIISK